MSIALLSTRQLVWLIEWQTAYKYSNWWLTNLQSTYYIQPLQSEHEKHYKMLIEIYNHKTIDMQGVTKKCGSPMLLDMQTEELCKDVMRPLVFLALYNFKNAC